MEILQFIGTCSSSEIGQFAEKKGKKASWNNAKKAILNYDYELYKSLSLNLKTYYEHETNVKTGYLLGMKGKFLHIIHSAVDYIFLIK